MSATARGVPYPAGSSSNNVPSDLQALAQWVNDRPGTAVLSTTQRNTLAAVDVWAGKVIFNTTTARLEYYDGNAWQPVVPVPAPSTDTNWVDLTPGGWSGQASYIRKSGFVTVTLALGRSAFNAGDGIFALPSGFAPNRSIPAQGGYGSEVRPFNIYPSGSLNVGSNGSGGIYGTATFPVGG